MRKAILILMACMICSVCYGDASYLSTETIANRIFSTSKNAIDTTSTYKRGTTTFLRKTLSGDSGAIPSTGKGVDCTGYNKAVVSFDMSEDDSWVVIPAYYNSSSAQYHKGTARTISGDTDCIVDVAGNSDFYILVQDVPGGAGSLTIWVTPTN